MQSRSSDRQQYLIGDYIRSALLVASILVAASLSYSAPSPTDSSRHWVGTWAAAPYAAGTNTPPSPFLANNTFRQILRVSIGGDTLRVKFSNGTCATPVTINSVNIAVSPDGTKSAVTASTVTQLKFNGNAAVTMAARGSAVSDPVAFPLTPNMRLAITIYYGQCPVSSDMTHHYGSRTDSYILTGNQTANAAFTGATVAERWYHISGIDVLAPPSAAAVVALGNSITDGYGLHGGLQNRWTDLFSQKLLANAATSQVSVLNMGIGGTNVAGTGATTGATRYQQDVLNQPGVKWIIVLYGINDIGASNSSAATITAAYQKMIADAHARNLKIYGATITPVRGNAYYSDAHEQVRSAVNKWIRTPGIFDAFIDFDKTVRDPADTARLLAAYSNDWLHPNAAGYKAMGESINPDLFILPVKASRPAQVKGTGDVISTVKNGRTTISFELPCASFVSLKVYSMQGKEIGEFAGRNFFSGRHDVGFTSKNLAAGTWLYAFRSGAFQAFGRIVAAVD